MDGGFCDGHRLALVEMQLDHWLELALNIVGSMDEAPLGMHEELCDAFRCAPAFRFLIVRMAGCRR